MRSRVVGINDVKKFLGSNGSLISHVYLHLYGNPPESETQREVHPTKSEFQASKKDFDTHPSEDTENPPTRA